MSKLPLFKDLKKRSSDLLTKEFPGDKSEKKLEYKGDNSVGGFEALFNQDDKGVITGTVKPKVVIKNYNAEINGEINTKQTLKAEVSVQDQFLSGLKTIASANQSNGEVFGAIGGEYKHENVTVNTTVEIGKKSGPSVALASALGKNGYSLGFSTKYTVSKSSVDFVDLVVSHRSAEFDASAFGSSKTDSKSGLYHEVGFSYFHDINSDLAFGAEGVYNLTNKNVDINAGLQYKVSSDTTVKGKFSNAGKLGLSYQQKLNSRTKFTLSHNVDLQAVQAGKSGSTLGFSLNFNA